LKNEKLLLVPSQLFRINGLNINLNNWMSLRYQMEKLILKNLFWNLH